MHGSICCPSKTLEFCCLSGASALTAAASLTGRPTARLHLWQALQLVLCCHWRPLPVLHWLVGCTQQGPVQADPQAMLQVRNQGDMEGTQALQPLHLAQEGMRRVP